jgi:hypothetical protein
MILATWETDIRKIAVSGKKKKTGKKPAVVAYLSYQGWQEA